MNKITAPIIICGPPASGKTHIANIFKALYGDDAITIHPDYRTLKPFQNPDLIVLEECKDIEEITALFDRFNARGRLLIFITQQNIQSDGWRFNIIHLQSYKP